MTVPVEKLSPAAMLCKKARLPGFLYAPNLDNADAV